MPLPSSGPLTLTDIQTEFGGTNPIGLSEYYRNGPFVPDASTTATIPTSGTISMSNFFGTRKRVGIPLNITSPTYNFDVYANRGPNYVAGISDIQVTVAPDVLVGSTSTSAYSMLVPNSFNASDTVTIVNNGTIQGMGGTGGRTQFATGYLAPPVPQPPDTYGNPVPPAPGLGGQWGTVGGPGLYVNRPTIIQNNNVIAGGGGGGGGGAGWTPYKGPNFYGTAGGGGAGYNGGPGGGPDPVHGGPSGSPGTSGAGGASGGLPGTRGDGQGVGGDGGGQGQPGAAGQNQGGVPGGQGGVAGNAIVGNSFITYTATGTRNGPIVA